MNRRLHSWHTVGTLLVLLSFSLGALQAAPGNGKGGGNKGGSSQSGEHGKQAKGVKSTGKNKAPEAALAGHSKLSAKLEALLPPGTDLLVAATGFKNLGQFVAAVHVSYNLGIPFDQLRTEMVDSGASLGQAIRKLRPDVDADAEEEEAEDEAEEELS